MKVTLLTYTPEPDRVVATAARLCYSPKQPAEIWATFTPEEQKTFLQRIMENGHESPLEHAAFTFSIEGVSRALSHQLVRHRIASYSQRSQRYVTETGFNPVLPPSVAQSPDAKDRFTQVIKSIRDGYTDLVKMGIPKEDARYLLPNACETQLIMSMNARSLLNFLELRCCRRAQWEIRDLAWRIRTQVRTVAPVLFAISGPSCLAKGYCREGALSCGQPYEEGVY